MFSHIAVLFKITFCVKKIVGSDKQVYICGMSQFGMGLVKRITDCAAFQYHRCDVTGRESSDQSQRFRCENQIVSDLMAMILTKRHLERIRKT